MDPQAIGMRSVVICGTQGTWYALRATKRLSSWEHRGNALNQKKFRPF